MLRLRPTSQQPSAKLVETNKCNIFAMIYKLLKLALLLSIASVSVSNLDFSPTCTKCLSPPLAHSQVNTTGTTQVDLNVFLFYGFF